MPSMPALVGATLWINSVPLSPAALRGRVVLVNFWTLTSIDWVRTAPQVRAWSRAYRDDGLVVIGVHTPEFAFERDTELVELAVRARQIDYPVAVDNEYVLWSAFSNTDWPEVHLVDAEGIRRAQHHGGRNYDQVERAIQRVLGVDRPFVSARGVGAEAEADWQHLHSPETYLGYARGTRLSTANGSSIQTRHHYRRPVALPLNHWSLEGEWTIGHEHVELHRAGGSVAHRFIARDVHLVMSTLRAGAIPFRVMLDGVAPGPAHGVDIDEDGFGALREGRLYQLIRADDDVRERLVEVSFAMPGVLVYVLTFG